MMARVEPLLRRHVIQLVQVVIGPVRQRHDLARLRTHHDHRGHLRLVLLHRRVELRLDDHLQARIDREPHIVAIARGALLLAETHHLLPLPVALRVAETVVPAEVAIERFLHALQTFVVVVHRAHDVAHQLSIRIHSHGILLEKHRANLLLRELRGELHRRALRQIPAQDDIPRGHQLSLLRRHPLAPEPRLQRLLGHAQRLGQQLHQRRAVLDERAVRHHRFHRLVLRQRHSAHVEDRAPARVNRLAQAVVLARLRLILGVFRHLQVDQPKRKNREPRGESAADGQGTKFGRRAHGTQVMVGSRSRRGGGRWRRRRSFHSRRRACRA